MIQQNHAPPSPFVQQARDAPRALATWAPHGAHRPPARGGERTPATPIAAAIRMTNGPTHSTTGAGFEWRLEQHEVAITRDQVIADLVIALARCDLLADQHPQFLCDIGVGIGDRLALANHAADLARQVAGALPLAQDRGNRRLVPAPAPARPRATAGATRRGRVSWLQQPRSPGRPGLSAPAG